MTPLRVIAAAGMLLVALLVTTPAWGQPGIIGGEQPGAAPPGTELPPGLELPPAPYFPPGYLPAGPVEPSPKWLPPSRFPPYLYPTANWFGGFYILPQDDNNARLRDDGAGLTYGVDWTRIDLDPVWLGPSFNVDVYGQAFNDDVQLNQASDPVTGVREGRDVLGVNLRPGVRGRAALTENANVFVDAQLLVKYQTAKTDVVALDAAKPQIPVSEFRIRDWDWGWCFGGGLEYLTEGGLVLRP
ncbi:MAG: hypothetical protein HYS13_20675, partial [Planctomycetia bacterium]|nr:hypothetical protein [Planctomycetia bacterium]